MGAHLSTRSKSRCNGKRKARASFDQQREKGFVAVPEVHDTVDTRTVYSRTATIPLGGDLAYASVPKMLSEDEQGGESYRNFIRAYPEYGTTWPLDKLRQTDFTRLDKNDETYVDYMGAALYPESLVHTHAQFLLDSVLGNTHSVSNSSALSMKHAKSAKSAVLSFFNAPPSEYTVVFTANASAALKLVGEAFPFGEGSSFVLAADSHNSVNGIRRYASTKGARCAYLPSLATGGFDPDVAKHILHDHRPRHRAETPSLLALTAQSNATNTKNPLSITDFAWPLGYRVLLDAAAWAPTSPLSLADYPGIDAMAISFYKMFGFPTGIGALVVKHSFLAELKRPWFAGGTVSFVQVPGDIVRMSDELEERFADGTINYLSLAAVEDGLRFLTGYMPFISLRLSCLLHYLISSLKPLKHDVNGASLLRVVSRTPTRRLTKVGETSDTGFMVSMLFYDPSGTMIPNSFIEYAASRQRISLRAGCVCNPGGVTKMVGVDGEMAKLTSVISSKEFERLCGHEVGIIRVSLGLVSNFQDVQRVIEFAASLGSTEVFQSLMHAWRVEKAGSMSTH